LKSKLFYILYTIALGFVLYITFTNSQFSKTISSSESISNRVDQLSTAEYTDLYKELSSDEKENFSVVMQNIKMASQIMRELDYLLEEMEKGDDLESAIDAMSIAHEETLIVIEKVSNANFHTSKLIKLQRDVTNVLTDFTEGIGILLEGFEHGEGEQMQIGYQQTNKAKENFSILETSLKDI
jgi:hypothetical protein